MQMISRRFACRARHANGLSCIHDVAYFDPYFGKMAKGDVCLRTICPFIRYLDIVAATLAVIARLDDLSSLLGGKDGVMVGLDVYAIVHLADIVNRVHPHTKGRGYQHKLVAFDWHGIVCDLHLICEQRGLSVRCLLSFGLDFCLHLLHHLTVNILESKAFDSTDEILAVSTRSGIACLVKPHAPSSIVICRKSETAGIALIVHQELAVMFIGVCYGGILAELLIGLVICINAVSPSGSKPRWGRLDAEVVVFITGKLTLSVGTLQYALSQYHRCRDAVTAHLLHGGFLVSFYVFLVLGHLLHTWLSVYTPAYSLLLKLQCRLFLYGFTG